MNSDDGMVNIELDDLVLSVDRETARILQTDPEARKSYVIQIKQQLSEREQQAMLQTELQTNNISVPVWKTSKNQTDRDRTATIFFLGLRKKYEKEFVDKKTNKNSIWLQIANIMNDSGFYVGDGTDGREKCRQKFTNLQASYIKYIDKIKQTGQGKIIKPPYFDELDDILGDKHKAEPLLVLDSLPKKNNKVTENMDVSENTSNKQDTEQPSTSNRFKEIKPSVKPNKNDILQKMYELNKENQKINERNFQNMMEFLNKESDQRHKQMMSLIENIGKKTKKGREIVTMIQTEV